MYVTGPAGVVEEMFSHIVSKLIIISNITNLSYNSTIKYCTYG